MSTAPTVGGNYADAPVGGYFKPSSEAQNIRIVTPAERLLNFTTLYTGEGDNKGSESRQFAVHVFNHTLNLPQVWVFGNPVKAALAAILKPEADDFDITTADVVVSKSGAPGQAQKISVTFARSTREIKGADAQALKAYVEANPLMQFAAEQVRRDYTKLNRPVPQWASATEGGPVSESTAEAYDPFAGQSEG